MRIAFIFPAILALWLFSTPIRAQKLAVIVPEQTELTTKFEDAMRDSLLGRLSVINGSLSETAFHSVTVENAFNMTAAESKRIAAVIGCDYFLIFRTGTLRRSSLTKPDYYEAFNVSYLVSGRTGRLAHWNLKSFESDTPANAEKLLLKSIDDLSKETTEQVRDASKIELSEKSQVSIENVPQENSAESKSFRPPLPYKRIKPEYTRIAYLYDAKGTIDILVDIDEKGVIQRTEIVRWAGYGLDESVIEAVRKMNWRPAERNSKPLPMRVLLRYNFTKVEKE